LDLKSRKILSKATSEQKTTPKQEEYNPEREVIRKIFYEASTIALADKAFFKLFFGPIQ